MMTTDKDGRFLAGGLTGQASTGQPIASSCVDDGRGVRKGLAAMAGMGWTVRPDGRTTLRETDDLDGFLAGIERRAFRMALLSVGGEADALDLVQEAMCRFVGRYAERPPEQWRPLFHRILQNLITDWHRRRWIRDRWQRWTGRGGDDVDPIEAVADPRTGERPEGRAESAAALEALERALAALPLRQRQAVVLRLWEGFDVRQTAGVMGCSEGSVKTHYSRGIHALRERLGDHWP